MSIHHNTWMTEPITINILKLIQRRKFDIVKCLVGDTQDVQLQHELSILIQFSNPWNKLTSDEVCNSPNIDPLPVSFINCSNVN